MRTAQAASACTYIRATLEAHSRHTLGGMSSAWKREIKNGAPAGRGGQHAGKGKHAHVSADVQKYIRTEVQTHGRTSSLPHLVASFPACAGGLSLQNTRSKWSVKRGCTTLLYTTGAEHLRREQVEM